MDEQTEFRPEVEEKLKRLRSLESKLEEAAEVTRRLAHEFGNRMTVVLGFSELALQTTGSHAATSGYIREVLESAYRTSNWLKRLHFFSRRKSPKDFIPTSIQGEFEAYLESWKSSGVPITIKIAPGLPPVACDAESFKEILHSLLDNAVKACKAGGGKISVELRPRTLAAEESAHLLGNPPAGQYLEISVQDTGTGISPEMKNVVLQQPFFSGVPGQIGLGLAEIYGVSRRYHGGISWDFDTPKQASFTILLPFSQNH